jgi:tungstate transport system ATP-binding protein
MSRNEAPLFQLRQVRKEYGDTVAVDVGSHDVPTGEILCLLGPTGAGKSTLLRLLAAVERSTTGDIFFQGNSLRIESLPLSTRRYITMVFQRPLLLTRTVRSNVEYGLRMRDGKDFSAGKVDRILELLGLSKLAAQSARTLSGGQTQLVALARALVLEPNVLLLDEPTANLDPAHVALVERVIQEDFQQRRTSVVWATHNLFQARRIAQRVALILNGRLVEVAPNDLFFHSPSDPRTSDFVEGKMVY